MLTSSEVYAIETQTQILFDGGPARVRKFEGHYIHLVLYEETSNGSRIGIRRRFAIDEILDRIKVIQDDSHPNWFKIGG